MNDIYEQKAKKYKYKYLELKAEIEGGVQWYNPLGIKKPGFLKTEADKKKSAEKLAAQQALQARKAEQTEQAEQAEQAQQEATQKQQEELNNCKQKIRDDLSTFSAFENFKKDIGKELEYSFRQQTDEGDKENKRLQAVDNAQEFIRRHQCSYTNYNIMKSNRDNEKIKNNQAQAIINEQKKLQKEEETRQKIIDDYNQLIYGTKQPQQPQPQPQLSQKELKEKEEEDFWREQRRHPLYHFRAGLDGS